MKEGDRQAAVGSALAADSLGETKKVQVESNVSKAWPGLGPRRTTRRAWPLTERPSGHKGLGVSKLITQADGERRGRDQQLQHLAITFALLFCFVRLSGIEIQRFRKNHSLAPNFACSLSLFFVNVNLRSLKLVSMSLWVDKHRPRRLAKLDFHNDQAQHLARLVSGGDFPHLLLSGPSGCGKRTRVSATLRELYGAGAERLRIEHQTYEASSGRKVEVTTVASNYHIEVNPSDAGIYDRVVVQELIKTAAGAQQLNSDGQREFKVVVVNEADKLSKDAQHALRRTMEKYMATCRIFLVANSTSKVIPAIRSRCLIVRVAAPTAEQVAAVVQSVARKEGCTMPDTLAKRIAEKSGRNLRRALLMAQACRVQQYPFSDDQEVRDLDWELYLRETAHHILRDQTPAQLLVVRQRLYELLTHCIPADVIFV